MQGAVAQRVDAPRFSIVVPAYKFPPPRWLAACLDCVLKQSYPHWELCIADDASTIPASREIIARYAARDPRIRVVWRTVNGHISAASNSALELATGRYVALLDHDDAMPSHALAEVALALIDRPDTAILYTDEDKMNEDGERFEPYFKPDWNSALASSQNFVSHLGVYTTDLIRSVGGFRQGFEGAQDWDLLLRCAERVDPLRILHVAQVLYHWRSIAGSTANSMASKEYARVAQEQTVREHARRCGVEIGISRVGVFLQADPMLASLPATSLVVLHSPSMPSSEAVARWRAHAEAEVIEILPVPVEGEAPRELNDAPLRLGRGGASEINSMVATAKGDLIEFVCGHAAPSEGGWLKRLAGHALQPGNGCVGGVTLDAMRRTARGGYILDPEVIAATAFAREPHGFPSMMCRNRVVQNLSALCLSGLAVLRSAWMLEGGLDVAHLADACHDIDLCLRMSERGLRHVWHPGIVFTDERPLRIRGSPSRCSVEDAEDIVYMRARHRAVLAYYPAYNPHLSRPPRLFEIPGGADDGATEGSPVLRTR